MKGCGRIIFYVAQTNSFLFFNIKIKMTLDKVRGKVVSQKQILYAGGEEDSK